MTDSQTLAAPGIATQRPTPTGGPASAHQRGLVASAVTDDTFLRQGVVAGRDIGFSWVVVDPERHPLTIWERRSERPGAYLSTASSLLAAVYSNGPVMGKHLVFGRQADPAHIVAEVAAGAGMGAIVGGLFRGRRGAACGAAVGTSAAGWHCFNGWSSLGAIRSQHLALRTTETYDGQGPRYAWIGRSGTAFGTYRVGDGDPPTGQVEAMGGMLRVLAGYRATSTDPASPAYQPQLAAVAAKTGVVAWALVPLSGRPDTLAPGNGSSAAPSEAETASAGPSGVILVVGAAESTALQVGALLERLGASDAVATDLQRCSLLGAGTEILLGRPWRLRHMTQRYGLSCS